MLPPSVVFCSCVASVRPMRQCRNATKRKDSISQTPITLSICLASPINISVTGELNYQTYSGSGMPSLSLRLNSKYPHSYLCDILLSPDASRCSFDVVPPAPARPRPGAPRESRLCKLELRSSNVVWDWEYGEGEFENWLRATFIASIRFLLPLSLDLTSHHEHSVLSIAVSL